MCNRRAETHVEYQVWELSLLDSIVLICVYRVNEYLYLGWSDLHIV